MIWSLFRWLRAFFWPPEPPVWRPRVRSVDDSLPPPGVKVFVGYNVSKHTFTTAYRDGAGGWFDAQTGTRLPEVRLWLPMPSGAQ